ncbi:zinc-dependent metalloprotease [Phaeodactylibacter luteus]|uniref:T9SS type A sorting domain-containing protein n=1 Tax=Phaeodactylibacter luteus TaxID=1564516 RepID=A0A5C6RJV3_9BACT|nr:zinc-dependent metalloprotease [Phaeodactylibacter luteus]TXB62189.1 T9SS type A sorting domain-containing protein [Phaeodactylibacter luteus]
MLKQLALTICTAACLAAPMLAQEHQHHAACGITQEDAHLITERLLENKAALEQGLIVQRDVVYIPVKFHLIGKSDGSGRISPARVLDQLCALNADFEPVGFQFYMKDGMNEIYNNTVYENHSATQNTIMEFQKDNNAINVFIPNNANTSGQSIGQTLGYYTPAKDWLVLKKSEVSGSNSTAPHEFGHFFSLPHPFNGWDFEVWDEATHGNPVTQTVAPNGVTPVELADGSNCNNAGDMICDTPANYGFGFGWNNCNFTEEVRDRNGDVLDPEERLFMSYFLNCDRDEYFFSDDQIALMQADYQSIQRQRIRTNHVPVLDEITAVPELVSPINSEIVPGYNAVNLNWDAVEGAQAYLLQISRLPTFSNTVMVYDEVVYGTSKVIESLSANTNYFWRVRPFSAYRACTDFSGAGAFTTGGTVDTRHIDLVEQFQVSPNPLKSADLLNVAIKSKQSFEASFAIYGLSGQLLQNLGAYAIAQGSSVIQLNNQPLPAGAYLLEIRAQSGREFQRIIVSE